MLKHNVIFYLTSWPAHAPYLIVSLKTLRRHWDGRILVYSFPQSFDLMKRIAEDESLGVEAKLWEPSYTGKNDQFWNKIKVAQSLDADVGLYLDADTSIHGDLTPLFGVAEEHGFCATRFSNWLTSGSVIQARVKRLREFPEINKRTVDAILKRTWLSVNGGVWTAKPNSPVLQTWEEWTYAARSVFIADEAVLHCLQLQHISEMEVWPDGRFNCSCNPKWLPKGMTEEDIVVWHYHGDSNVRPNKHGGAAHRRWWPMYRKCLKENVGGMREWIGTIENKWMKALKEEK